jgi:hypothetical protein
MRLVGRGWRGRRRMVSGVYDMVGERTLSIILQSTKHAICLATKLYRLLREIGCSCVEHDLNVKVEAFHALLHTSTCAR